MDVHAPSLTFASYVLQRRFLSDEACRLIFHSVELLQTVGRLRPTDGQVAGAPTLYGDPLTDALMQERLVDVEAAVGCALWPTYSYLRLHHTGAELPVHTDRKACEISVSINVNGDAMWPLWVRTADGDLPFEMGVGDALIYEGARMPHWWNPFPGTRQVQCLLHYVRRNGLFASQKYDGRPALGTPYIRDRIRAAVGSSHGVHASWLA